MNTQEVLITGLGAVSGYQEQHSGMLSRQIEGADRVVKMAVLAAHEALVMSGIKAEDVGLVSGGTGFWR